jgi:hypothetical protein
MKEYAEVRNNIVVGTKFIADDVYNTWVATNNTKLDIFFPIVDSVPPAPNQNQVVEYTYQLDAPNKVVNKVYTLRNKTPDELRQIWTSYEFLNRLTASERADIRQRALTDPNVADFLMLATAAQEVLSDDPVTIMGMGYMVMIGVFTEARKNEILGP